MARRKIKLTSINGVGVGQTATLDLPPGRRYFNVFLYYKGTANQATIEADITEIRVVVNGKVQRRFSAADLNVVNAFNGFAFRAGLIPIFFSEHKRRTIQGEEGLAWGTANVSTFRIEIDIAGTAVAPTLSARAEVDNAEVPLLGIIKWYKETFAATGAQTLNITTLPKLDAYCRLHARSALVTEVKVTVDQTEIYDCTNDIAKDFLARRSFAPVANNFHVAFDDDDQVTSALPMFRQVGNVLVPVNEFRVDVTASGAGNIPLLLERFGNPD